MSNIPRPSSKGNGSMMSFEADQPMKFSLMMGDIAAMIRPHHIDEDISKMSENMIGHGRCLQNKLRNISNECPKDGEDMFIMCVKEFRDEFNPHASKTTNNSVNLCTQSIFPAITSADSSHPTCSTGCGNKSKDNMENEQTCMDTFNKVSNLLNGKNTMANNCTNTFKFSCEALEL